MFIGEQSGSYTSRVSKTRRGSNSIVLTQAGLLLGEIWYIRCSLTYLHLPVRGRERKIRCKRSGDKVSVKTGREDPVRKLDSGHWFGGTGAWGVYCSGRAVMLASNRRCGQLGWDSADIMLKYSVSAIFWMRLRGAVKSSLTVARMQVWWVHEAWCSC